MTDQELYEKIGKMSLEDKALELTQFPAHELISEGEKIVTGVSDCADYPKENLWRTGTVLNAPDAETVTEIRRIRKEKGIEEPLLFMYDVIHGYRTIYPIPLALACSFDVGIIEECADYAATEAGFDGVDVTFSPMVDLVRDARWGRVMESAGEDPYWSGEVGKAFIRGYHEGEIACCVKHFAGYGAPEGGREYNTTDISERNLKQFYLAPYRACMEEKPELVMSSFNLLNGKPILGNKEIMIDTLRKEWGFDGIVISDYNAVAEMKNHGYLATDEECARVAAESELDIEMCSLTYAKSLPDLVRKGTIKEELVDKMVYRILKLKDKLGLYRKPNRLTDLKLREMATMTNGSRALARKAAEVSCVLLKNNGILPLKKSAKVALVGPFADEKEIYGNWGCHGRAEETVSVKEGFEAYLDAEVTCARGCSWKLFETDESGIEEAVNVAKGAKIIVACVGEHMDNSGEAHARADIRIPAVQRKLIERLHELNKPLVLVVFGGRPLVLGEAAEYASAILYAWQPGTEGGRAIAHLLYGKTNPCAKTVMSFPRSVGQCPIYYNHFPTGRPKNGEPGTELGGPMWRTSYDDEYNTPLYPFGYGLSYSRFEYSDLKLSSAQLRRGGKIMASVLLKNTSDVIGIEVVQWYLHDCFASVVRPVKELKGIKRVRLRPGEAERVEFEITEELLKFYADDGEFLAEAGGFELFVGGNSRDCLSAKFNLID